MNQYVQSSPFTDIRRDLTVRWPTYSTYWKEAFPEGGLDSSYPNTLDTQDVYLETYTQTSLVGLSIHPKHISCYRRSGSWYDLLNPNAICIGLLTPSIYLEDPTVRKQLQSLRFKVMALSVGASTDLECFCRYLLSAECPSRNDNVFRKREDITFLDCTDKVCLKVGVPVVNVMLLGENNGIYHRIGVGFIVLRQWAKLECTFEKVVLR
jgi:hypothetical protein